jgi:hypothetical protein
MLPHHLSLASRWRDVRAVLGDGIGWLELTGVVVEFCDFPRVRFEVRYPPADTMVSGPEKDLSFIPDDAELARVWVYSGEVLDSQCEARPARKQ